MLKNVFALTGKKLFSGNGILFLPIIVITLLSYALSWFFLTYLNEEKLQELANSFFLSKDEFIMKSGYTISIFQTQINKLSTLKKSRWK